MPRVVRPRLASAITTMRAWERSPRLRSMFTPPMCPDTGPGITPPAGPHDAEGNIGCPRCELSLPIRLSRRDEEAALWECDSCRARIAGVLVPHLATHLAHRIRLGQLHFDTRNSAPIPAGLKRAVAKLATDRAGRQQRPERRDDARITTHIEAAATRLDQRWAPLGEPFPVLVVDLSRGGLGMIAATDIDAPHVAVQIPGPAGSLQVLAAIKWSRDLGCGFHHVGAQFSHRLGRTARS